MGSESIAVGQCILVKWDESEDAKIDLREQWKAKVLEVRALDSEHVYIRVAWLNRPEDLSTGRERYHGKNELIPTNQMDIIDAMAVNGSVDVFHWDDKDDDSPLMNHVRSHYYAIRVLRTLTKVRINTSGDKHSTSQTQKSFRFVIVMLDTALQELTKAGSQEDLCGQAAGKP